MENRIRDVSMIIKVLRVTRPRTRQIPIAMVHESPRGRERAIFAIAGRVGLVDIATKQDHTEAKKKEKKNMLAET